MQAGTMFDLVRAMLDTILADVRHAIRVVLRRPGFTFAALLTLGLGIGANSAVFSLVNGVLLAPLPFGEKSPRIVTLHSTHPSQPEDWEDSGLSYLDLMDVRANSRTLEEVAGYVGRSFTLTTGGEAERLRGGSVTPNLFPLLGHHPLLGRHFRDEEAQATGFEPVVILSHRLWQQRFGGDPGIVGRSIRLNDRALSVVGVMPPRMRFPERDELWLPWRPQGEPPRTQRGISSFGVLREGATIAQAQQELDALAARLAEGHPETNRDWGMRALSFRDSVVDRGLRTVLGALLGAVAAVLLIGCANLANLILARGVSRQRELAVRGW
jgi:predicted permease